LQIVYGLLCAPDGCPVAIEVFDGNTGDPSTLAPQIEKLKQRFHLDHVVLVGDRGMITQARITEDLKSAGLDWITALRAPAIKDLLNSGALQLTLFDQRDPRPPPPQGHASQGHAWPPSHRPIFRVNG
jgi:transposase